jgi:signal transduction histidine kinase
MDIHVAITKGIAYVGVIGIIIGPAFAATILMQRLAFGSIHYDFSAAILSVLIAVGVTFPWVKSRAEQRVQQSLFRQQYESKLELQRFGRRVVQILDQKALMAELCQISISVFQADSAALYAASTPEGDALLVHWEGRRPTTDSLPCLSAQIRRVLSCREALLREELFPIDEKGSELDRCFELNHWEACLPMASEGIGAMLMLGRKTKLEPYTSGDLDLLNTVGSQVAVALENARLYGELRKSQEVIRRAGRLSALGTLAAGIAHEIRNPLVSIQTFFQLAPARVHDEEFLTSFLALTEGEVRRITDLITDLLNFAKSPSPVVQEHRVDSEIDGAVALLAPQARSQRVELVVVHGRDVPPILGDPDQLRQVLINLILNAIQATAEGGRVCVMTEPAEVDGSEFAVVRVRDTGPGIPPELHDDIFNPFFTTKAKGTGLGLAVSHQIVKEHGGFISVESSPGEGAEFAVYLPTAGNSARSDAVDRRAAEKSRKIA